MAAGKKRVERIPKDWVDDVRQRVAAGRAFQDALREVLAANAELLVLRRKQQPVEGTACSPNPKLRLSLSGPEVLLPPAGRRPGPPPHPRARSGLGSGDRTYSARP